MSQEDAILKHLQQGYTLTPFEALQRFGCFRLGARIYGLKRRGHNIETRIVEVGKGKHVAQYRLRETISSSGAQLGEAIS